MAKKEVKVDVLDQMYEATMIANEQKKVLDANKKDAEYALARELRRQKLPKNYTGEITYHDHKIRIQRRLIIQFMTE